MSKLLLLLLLAPAGFWIVQAYAITPDDYAHSQGDGYQCAASPTIETQCEIENILKDFFPKMLDKLTSINTNLGIMITNQNTIISNQNTEISLLQQLVPVKQVQTIQNPYDNVKTCHKSGTGILCN